MKDFVKRALVERAREFRTLPTQSEAMLWGALRDRQLFGVKFRRQVVIDAFVVDFCAARQHLIVEVDGSIHEEQKEQDAERQRWLETAGYRVLRVSAEAVENDLPTVLDMISKYLVSPSPSPRKP